MKNRNFLSTTLFLTITILSAKAQAGGQCSKGEVCSPGSTSASDSSSAPEDPKQKATQDRRNSRNKSLKEGTKLIFKVKVMQRGKATEEDEKRGRSLLANHKKVIEKWVSAHHPELRKGSPGFNQRVQNEMEADTPAH